MHINKVKGENPYLRNHVQRAFLKNLFWLQALNWLVKPLWILWIERTVQVQLGNEWYGQYFVHFNLGLLFAVLLDAGLNAYVSREVAANGKLLHFNRVLALRFGFSLLYIAAVAWLAYYQQLDWRILGFVVVNQILASILLFLRSVLQGKQQFIPDSVVSVTDRLVAILGSAWFLYGGSTFQGLNGIAVFLIAQMLGYVLAIFLALVFLKRIKSSSNEITEKSVVPEENTTDWKKWSKEVVWYVMMALFMSAFTRVDSLMIRNFSPDMFGQTGMESGYYQAGIYAQSYRLLDAGLIFSTLLSTQLLPVFSKNIASKENSSELLWLSFRLILLIGILAVTVSLIWGESLLNLLYGEKWLSVIDSDSGGISISKFSWMNFSVLMLTFMAMTSIHVFGTYITALGKMRWLTVMAFMALVTNVISNRYLIPSYGSLGAAMSALLTQWLFAALCFAKALSHKTVSWKQIKWKTAPMSFLLTLSILVSWWNIPEELRTYTLAVLAFSLILLGVIWMLFGKDIQKTISTRYLKR